MYYYNETFYSDLTELAEDIDIEAMNDTDTIKVCNCNLEPIVTLSADLIAENLYNDLEERHSEWNAEGELNEIIEALKRNIDFDKLNSELPILWYENNTFKLYSKAELLPFL